LLARPDLKPNRIADNEDKNKILIELGELEMPPTVDKNEGIFVTSISSVIC
jgi:hypothetical protein